MHPQQNLTAVQAHERHSKTISQFLLLTVIAIQDCDCCATAVEFPAPSGSHREAGAADKVEVWLQVIGQRCQLMVLVPALLRCWDTKYTEQVQVDGAVAANT